MHSSSTFQYQRLKEAHSKSSAVYTETLLWLQLPLLVSGFSCALCSGLGCASPAEGAALYACGRRGGLQCLRPCSCIEWLQTDSEVGDVRPRLQDCTRHCASMLHSSERDIDGGIQGATKSACGIRHPLTMSLAAAWKLRPQNRKFASRQALHCTPGTPTGILMLPSGLFGMQTACMASAVHSLTTLGKASLYGEAMFAR